jgi:predicted AAA+ superfamily ATPase
MIIDRDDLIEENFNEIINKRMNLNRDEEIKKEVLSILFSKPSDKEIMEIKKSVDYENIFKSNNPLLKKIYYQLEKIIDELIIDKTTITIKGKPSKLLINIINKNNWSEAVITKLIHLKKLRKLLD